MAIKLLNEKRINELVNSYSKQIIKIKAGQKAQKEAIKKHPCVWTSYSNDEKTKTDYWKLILTNYK